VCASSNDAENLRQLAKKSSELGKLIGVSIIEGEEAATEGIIKSLKKAKKLQESGHSNKR